MVDQDPDPGDGGRRGLDGRARGVGRPGHGARAVRAGPAREQAIDRLEDRGLRAELERRPSDDVEAGLALRTVPAAGEPVERGETRALFVSSGPEQVEVPDVIGLSRDSAEEQPARRGPQRPVSEQESDEPEGEVISQDPAGGAEVDRGTAVTITVSTGLEQVDVPNVLGLNARDAAAQLAADGLVSVQREQQVTDPAQDGKVIDQRPAAGTEVEEGRQVVIIVGAFVEEEVLEPGEEPGTPP